MVVDAGAGIFVVAVLTTLAVTGAIVFVKGPDTSSNRRHRRPASRPRGIWMSGAQRHHERPWPSVHDKAPSTSYQSQHRSGPPFKYSEEAQFKIETLEDVEAPEVDSLDQNYVPLVVDRYNPVHSEHGSSLRHSSL